MIKKVQLACLASGTAALLIILPLAWAPMTNRLGGASILPAARPEEQATSQRAQNAVKFATNAAYFDGVFQGKLAASQRLERRIPLGRWSSTADRDAFATGYRDGLAQALMDNKLPVPAQ